MEPEPTKHDWMEESLSAVTVCDADGIIIAMNAASRALFAKDGGAALIGTDLLACHPEPAKPKLRKLMEKRGTNAYTIEKNDAFRLILQIPWYRGGAFAGYVEIGSCIDGPLPHFLRK